ncbi:DNA-binding protein SMUBP-2 [Harmonia axyridis]|uniref:DNA-binding protein SMUBP-2 n=1 Tax=Harmonia axyridis TaxID=115357 RepID=UPI001E276824|nr:DNA-binding protein SMUBP-2 [Harmonia axyridis]
MSTITQTKTKEKPNLKNKESDLQKITASKNLDEVLENVKKLDNSCSYTKCKTSIANFAIDCKYCKGRFCPTHSLPEIHGCGEAVRKDEKEKFNHPYKKLDQENHQKAQTKLTMKLKQLQLERKAKPGNSSKGKKK